MADFRRLLFAFAVVAFLVSLTVPAYADFNCSGTADNRPTRAESFNDKAGDIVLTCSGGNPTAPGSTIPPTTISVTANTNITSRILAQFTGSVTGGVTTQFNEALLIIDEPNTSTAVSANLRNIRNCGWSGEDSNAGSGPGVCRIIAPANPVNTYDGNEGIAATGAGGTDEACNGGTVTALPAVNTFGCGRPNVFQGRQAISLVSGQFNAIQFVGVPLDPPCTTSGCSRVIRITNVRIDSTRFGVASPFSTVPVTATVSFAGFLNVPDVTVQIANVQQGLSSTVYNGQGFLQCVGTDQEVGIGAWGGSSPDSLNGPKNPSAANKASSPFFSGTGGSAPTGAPSPTGGMDIRLQENFSTAWKVRNLVMYSLNGIFPTSSTNSFVTCRPGACNVIPPTGTTWVGFDWVQNVPGVNYNSEAGFENAPFNGQPTNSGITNPPPGFGSPLLPSGGGFLNPAPPFQNGGANTGIATAGVASQGTRMSIQVSTIPNGARLFFPVSVQIKDQTNGQPSGLMQVDALADQNGFSSFQPGLPAPFLTGIPTAFQFTGTGSTTPTTVTNPNWVEVTAQFPVVTYEVLFSRPDALEFADVTPTVVYNANSLSTGLPQTGVTVTASASFSPIQSAIPNANRPQQDGLYATPRFTNGFKSPGDPLFTINACACNLLFPWVVSAGTVDTGIVVANTSMDPCGGQTAPTCALPFTGGPNQAIPQTGTVTFYYFGTTGVGDHNPVANLSPNTSLAVPAGGYLTHVLSQNTTATNGLGSRTNFAGYVIATANFQYCHAVADITAGSNAIFNYVALQLDGSRLTRTNQIGENVGH